MTRTPPEHTILQHLETLQRQFHVDSFGGIQRIVLEHDAFDWLKERLLTHASVAMVVGENALPSDEMLVLGITVKRGKELST